MSSPYYFFFYVFISINALLSRYGENLLLRVKLFIYFLSSSVLFFIYVLQIYFLSNPKDKAIQSLGLIWLYNLVVLIYPKLVWYSFEWDITSIYQCYINYYFLSSAFKYFILSPLSWLIGQDLYSYFNNNFDLFPITVL